MKSSETATGKLMLILEEGEVDWLKALVERGVFGLGWVRPGTVEHDFFSDLSEVMDEYVYAKDN